MAQEKTRAFRLTINGIQQSVDAVKSLSKELDTLESKIKGLSNRKIVISGTVDTKQAEKKVVSGKASSSDANLSKELEIQKQINAELKEKAKLEAASTEEWQKSFREQQKTKDEITQIKNVQKDMLKGARDDAGNYTNTLAGLRANLSDLKKQLATTELGTEAYDKLNAKTKELNDNVMMLEKSYGVFQRNVGNYPTAQVEALNAQFAAMYAEMQKLTQESFRLTNALANAKPGTDEFVKLEKELKNVDEQLARSTQSVNEFIKSINSTPKSIRIEVNGTVREFENARVAVRELNKDLQTMALEGKTNTQEFTNLMKTLAQLKTAIKNTSSELNSYVGNSKALNDTLTIMRGATGIAQIGQGLAGLFGGQNKELDESLRKFMSLTLLFNGLDQQIKAMNDEQNIWGRTLGGVWSWLDKIGKWTGADWLIGKTQKLVKDTEEWKTTLDTISKWNGEERYLMKQNIGENIVLQLNQSIDNATPELRKKIQTILDTFGSVQASANLQIHINNQEPDKAVKDIEYNIFTIEQHIIELNRMLSSRNLSKTDLDMINDYLESYKERLDKLKDYKIKIESGDAKAVINDLNADIDILRNEIDSLDGSEIDTTNLKKLVNEYIALSKAAVGANKNLERTPKMLKLMGNAGLLGAKAMNLLAVGLKTATVALKGLLKATVVLYLVQLAFEAITWAVEGLGKAWSIIKGEGGLDIDKRMDMIASSTERANQKLESLLGTVERMKKNGLIDAVTQQALSFELLEDNVLKTANAFLELAKLQDEIKQQPLTESGYGNGNVSNLGGIWGIDNIDTTDAQKALDEFIQRYKVLEKAVQAGTDITEAGWEKSTGWLTTAGDAVELLGDDTKRIMGQMQNDIDNIDWSNPEKAVKDLVSITNNELYKSAIANADQLFPDEEWAKVWINAYKNVEDAVNKMNGKLAEYRDAVIDANNQMAEQTRLSLINSIEDPLQRQRELDEYNRDKRRKEIENSLADEQHKREAIEALNEEYDQKAREREKNAREASKSNADALTSALKSIRDNQLAIQKEGLDKEIQQLKNAWDDEIAQAKKSGVKVKEQILAINAKYNFLITKKEQDWLRKNKEILERHNADMLAIQKEYLNELARINETARMNDVNRNLDVLETLHADRVRAMVYDEAYTTSHNAEQRRKELQQVKKHNDSLLEETKNYTEEKYTLMREESKRNMEMLLAEEGRNYEADIAQWSQNLNQKQKELEDNLSQGLITQEQYDEMFLETQKSYDSAMDSLIEGHNTKVEEIQKNHSAELVRIDNDAKTEMYQNTLEYNQKQVDAISNMLSEVNDMSKRQQTENTNRHTGLFNIVKERKRLEEVVDAYTEAMDEVDAQYEELKRQLNDGEIDFDGFTEAKRELENLKGSLYDTAKETANELNDLTQNYMQKLSSFVSKIGGELNGMLSTWSDIQSIRLDIQQDMLDKEQDMLDKETDMLEKAMERQADIVDRYKDRINETEDDLKDARGERRLALLEQLEAQKKAYEKETDVLKKQELEKEKIEAKEERLKQKQDALERKRKIQQRDANAISAIINTAMGVTQALGAYPPPYSYILAAAVGALGAAQISMIKSQRFSNGGKFEGPSHAQGGIKYNLGNRIIEVEGGEYCINKTTTKYNEGVISYINSQKRPLSIDDFEKFYSSNKIKISPSHALKYESGGVLPQINNMNIKDLINYREPFIDERDIVVSVVDILNTSDNYKKVRVLSGLD